jgi:hypothetical protein
MYTLNTFWQIKYERDARQCSTINTCCICEKYIVASRLFEDNWQTGASRLQRDVTCVSSRIVTGILCLFNQTNCIALQPAINILIWVAWLLDHPAVRIRLELKRVRVRSQPQPLFLKQTSEDTYALRNSTGACAEFESRLVLLASMTSGFLEEVIFDTLATLIYVCPCQQLEHFYFFFASN